jgi:CDP-glucose 4,6-dehydratase
MANQFWQDRRVFVTGCNGLVGSQTVELLLEHGARVVGLVRDHVPGSKLLRAGLDAKINIVRGPVEDLLVVERALNEYEIDTIFHLAAQTIVGTANRNPFSTFETNIKGTWCVLEAARRCGARPQVIVASSDKAYGDQLALPYIEESPLNARYPYDVSKACADMLANSYYQTFGLPVCVTRCGNFYGGGDLNMSRLVPGTIHAALSGQRPVIRSDGTFLRDYFYVKDGAAAYLHLAECLARQPKLAGNAFNFSTEKPLSVLQLVARILRLIDSDLMPDVRNEATHEIKHQYLSAEKARTLLNWRPLYSLDQALRETIDWYREYFAERVEFSDLTRSAFIERTAA